MNITFEAALNKTITSIPVDMQKEYITFENCLDYTHTLRQELATIKIIILVIIAVYLIVSMIKKYKKKSSA